MNNFHKIILPDFLAVHLQGGPIYENNVIKSVTGREVRIATRLTSYQKYTFHASKLSRDQFAALHNFFRCRRANLYSFLIKDFADFEIKEQILIHYSEEYKGYEVYKIYKDGLFEYARRIRHLKEDSLTLNIIAEEIDYERGIVVAPKTPSPPTISCNYYVKVRFISEDLKYKILKDGSALLEEIGLVEVE